MKIFSRKRNIQRLVFFLIFQGPDSLKHQGHDHHALRKCDHHPDQLQVIQLRGEKIYLFFDITLM